MEWVAIAPGSYLMGGIEDDKFVSSVELPEHPVKLRRGFWISRHPVTRRQWQIVMGALPEAAPAGSPETPVVGVNWNEALDFCQKLTEAECAACRLPTEAEWEYVCRGGSTTVFPEGNDITPCQANFLYDEWGAPVGPGHLTEVGRYGMNRFGVADMLGNVCEWTADLWHPGFNGAPADGSPWIRGGQPGKRVIRGGAWDHLPRVLRASWRDWAPETARWDNLGFRTVRESSEP